MCQALLNPSNSRELHIFYFEESEVQTLGNLPKYNFIQLVWSSKWESNLSLIPVSVLMNPMNIITSQQSPLLMRSKYYHYWILLMLTKYLGQISRYLHSCSEKMVEGESVQVTKTNEGERFTYLRIIFFLLILPT